MYQIQVQGVERTIRNLNNMAIGIKKATQIAMEFAGEKVIAELNSEFPDMKFSVTFFPESLELWINAGGIVICKATGKRVSNIENQLGRSQPSGEYGIQSKGKATFVKEFNLQDVAEKYGKLTAQLIREKIIGVLK